MFHEIKPQQDAQKYLTHHTGPRIRVVSDIYAH